MISYWTHAVYYFCSVFTQFFKKWFHAYILAWLKLCFPLYSCNCGVKRRRKKWFYVLSFKKYVALSCCHIVCHIWTWVPVVYFFFSQYLAVFTFIAFIGILRCISIISFLEKYIYWLLSKEKSCLFWQQIQHFTFVLILCWICWTSCSFIRFCYSCTVWKDVQYVIYCTQRQINSSD